MINEGDSDGSRTIDFSEFLIMMAQAMKNPIVESDLRQAFQVNIFFRSSVPKRHSLSVREVVKLDSQLAALERSQRETETYMSYFPQV